jgi:hypothetical protein
MRLTDYRAYRSLRLLCRGRAIVSSETFELIYDGPALSAHQMDVRDLVPALQGLGNLIREANTELNGHDVTINVLINSEHKIGCFSILVDVVQGVPEAFGALLGSGAIKSAKDLLEWLDLFGVGPKGVFAFLTWRNGREIESAQQINDSVATGNIQITVKGDRNNVFVLPESAYKIATNPAVARSIKQMISPLKVQGIDEIASDEGSGVRKVIARKGDVDAIDASCEETISHETVLGKNTIVAHLRPYDTEFSPEAKTWGFWYGDKHITVDITETDIARDAVARRQVSMDDIYKVDLEITETKTASGYIKLSYKATALHGRELGPEQIELIE